MVTGKAKHLITYKCLYCKKDMGLDLNSLFKKDYDIWGCQCGKKYKLQLKEIK